MSNSNSSSRDTSDSEIENPYCVFLHIVEGIGISTNPGLDASSTKNRESVKLVATLNGVRFEIRGFCTDSVTIFNSNCIWEADLSDIKRMKGDNRPVKVECYVKHGSSKNAVINMIGCMLLPLRSIPVVNTEKAIQFQLHWHKLLALHADWRDRKPEIFMMLGITKKHLVDSGIVQAYVAKKSNLKTAGHVLNTKTSETEVMLHSQSNIYVNLVERDGVIQVGNDFEKDCDIFFISLYLNQIKQVQGLLGSFTSFTFQYEFLGSTQTVEVHMNRHDEYPVNERMSMTIKSCLESLRIYFHSVFYLPINLCANGLSFATHRLDFADVIPMEDNYFESHTEWRGDGMCTISQICLVTKENALKPILDYSIEISLMTKNGLSQSVTQLQENILENTADCGMTELYRNTEFSQPLPEAQPNQMQRDATRIDKALEAFEHKILQTALHEPAAVVKHTETVNVAVGTDELPVEAALLEQVEECITLKMVQELEQWKSHEMNCFVAALERKEAEHLAKVQTEAGMTMAQLQQELANQTAMCEELRIQMEVKNAKLQAQEKIAEKADAATMQNSRLRAKLEQQRKIWQAREAKTAIERKTLEEECTSLREKLAQLELQIERMEKTHIGTQDVKVVVNDLRETTKKLILMEKSMIYYKNKCEKIETEYRELLYQREEELIRNKAKPTEINICMNDIMLGKSSKEPLTPKAEDTAPQTAMRNIKSNLLRALNSTCLSSLSSSE